MAKPIIFYIKAFGLSMDKDGNLEYGALELEYGEFQEGKEKSYDELIKLAPPAEELLNACSEFAEIFELRDVQYITKEEYDRDYGNDEIYGSRSLHNYTIALG